MFYSSYTMFYGPYTMFYGPYTMLYGSYTMFCGPYTMFYCPNAMFYGPDTIFDRPYTKFYGPYIMFVGRHGPPSWRQWARSAPGGSETPFPTRRVWGRPWASKAPWRFGLAQAHGSGPWAPKTVTINQHNNSFMSKCIFYAHMRDEPWRHTLSVCNYSAKPSSGDWSFHGFIGAVEQPGIRGSQELQRIVRAKI